MIRHHRWTIILIATLFNVLLEYALRGVNHLRINPILAVFLFLNYFPYFIVMEDLIGRFGLRDYQVYVAGIFFTLLWQLLGPAAIYFPPLILGINWFILLFVDLIWWPTIQTVLAFYIANRLTPRRAGGALLSRPALGACFGAFAFITLLFSVFVPTPPARTLPAIVVLLVLLAGVGALFKRLLQKTPPANVTKFQPDRVLDGLAAFTVGYSLFSAIFLARDLARVHVTVLNPIALQVSIPVTALIALALWLRRWRTQRPIPV